MPVYNSEQYLKKSIESVITQSLKDIELLLVDDGSTDSSGEICDYYAKQDKRIRVFHQKNQGQCAGRNNMIENCVGEYIAFIDNDDVFLDNVLESNYEIAKSTNADIVKFGFRVEEQEKNFTEVRDRKSNSMLTITKMNKGKCYHSVEESGYFSSVWNGLYKRAFIVENNLRFDESIRFGFEDCIFNIECYNKADYQVINPTIGYLYYMRYLHSTFKKFDENKIYAMLKMVKKEYELFKLLDLPNWPNRAMKRFLELLVMISKKNCYLATDEKINLIVNLNKREEFRVNYDEFKQNNAFRDRIVIWLLGKKQYKTLITISKLYTSFIDVKRTLKNRRD